MEIITSIILRGAGYSPPLIFITFGRICFSNRKLRPNPVDSTTLRISNGFDEIIKYNIIDKNELRAMKDEDMIQITRILIV